MENNSTLPEILQTPPVQPQAPPVSPPQTPPVVKKASKFSIKAIIGTIIFLLLAGGAAAGYVYREPLMTLVSKPTPTPTPTVAQTSPTPTPNPTADWETYEGDGFSFRYPNNLTAANPGKDTFYFNSNKEETLVISGGNLPLGIEEAMNDDLRRMSATKTTFLEKPAVQVRPARHTFQGEPFKALVVYLEDENRQIEIAYTGTGNNEILFDQILSTFKFTDDISYTTNYTSELDSFPVYPGSTFKEKQINGICPTDTTSGYSVCGLTTFKFHINDNGSKVVDYYKGKSFNSGWSCYNGGAGEYTDSNNLFLDSFCEKNGIRYKLQIDASENSTQITIGKPTT